MTHRADGKIDALLIANPAAGSGPAFTRSAGSADLDAVVAILRRSFDLEVATTQYPGHASELAHRAAEEGMAAVFALGGDGTAREVAAGLLQRPTALGLLPAGTSNVLAPAVGLPLDARRCAELYGSPAMRKALETPHPELSSYLDVGQIGERIFLMMASCGFDAEVMHHLPHADKKRFGRLAIVAQGLRQLLRSPPPLFSYRIADQMNDAPAASTRSHRRGSPAPLLDAAKGRCLRAGFLAVCNIHFYGGRFRLARQASPTDGWLDIIALHNRSRRGVLYLALCVLLGLRWRAGAVHTQALGITLEGEGPVRLQLDGDAVELPLPVVCKVLPRALRLLAPILPDQTT